MRLLPLAVVAVPSLLLSACVTDPGDGARAAEVAAVDGTVVVEMWDMYFDPAVVTVDPGEPLTLELVNEGGVNHDLAFEDAASPVVAPGDRATMQVGPFDHTVTAWCTVPGHRAAGMELEIRVER